MYLDSRAQLGISYSQLVLKVLRVHLLQQLPQALAHFTFHGCSGSYMGERDDEGNELPLAQQSATELLLSLSLSRTC